MAGQTFSRQEIMQRILQHPTATLADMTEGTEKTHIRLPFAGVERFRGTLDTVKRER